MASLANKGLEQLDKEDEIKAAVGAAVSEAKKDFYSDRCSVSKKESCPRVTKKVQESRPGIDTYDGWMHSEDELDDEEDLDSLSEEPRAQAKSVRAADPASSNEQGPPSKKQVLGCLNELPVQPSLAEAQG